MPAATGRNVRHPPVVQPSAENPGKGLQRKPSKELEDEFDVNFAGYSEKTGTTGEVPAQEFVTFLDDYPAQLKKLQERASFGDQTVVSDGAPLLTEDQLRAMKEHIARTADPDLEKKLFELSSTYAVLTPDVHKNVEDQNPAAARSIHVAADHGVLLAKLDFATIKRRIQIMYETCGAKEKGANLPDAEVHKLLRKCGRTSEEGLTETEAGRVVPFWFKRHEPELYWDKYVAPNKGKGKGFSGYDGGPKPNRGSDEYSLASGLMRGPAQS